MKTGFTFVKVMTLWGFASLCLPGEGFALTTVEAPSYGCGTYEISGVLFRGPFTAPMLRTRDTNGLDVEVFLGARSRADLWVFEGASVRVTARLSPTLRNDLAFFQAIDPVRINLEPKSYGIRRVSQEGCAVSLKFNPSDFFVATSWAENIAFNGATSWMQNFSFFDTAVSAFNREAFQGKAVILNTSGNKTGRVLQFDEIREGPFKGNYNWRRDERGFPVTSSTEVEGGAATAEALESAIKSAGKREHAKGPGGSVDLVVSDHGSPQGFLTWGGRLVNSSDLNHMDDAVPDDVFRRTVHLECHGGTFVWPSSPNLLQAYPKNRCHLALADFDETALVPETTQKVPDFWGRSLSLLKASNIPITIQNLKTSLTGDVLRPPGSNGDQIYALSSSDAFAVTFVNQVCAQAQSDAAGDRRTGEGALRCKQGENFYNSKCKDVVETFVKYRGIRDQSLLLNQVQAQMVGLGRALLTDELMRTREDAQRVSEMNSLSSELQAAWQKGKGLNSTKAERLRQLMDGMDQILMSKGWEAKMEDPAFFKAGLKAHPGQFPALETYLKGAPDLIQQPRASQVMAKVAPQVFAAKTARTKQFLKVREATQKLTRDLLFDPTLPQNAELGDRFKNLIACEAGPFGTP